MFVEKAEALRCFLSRPQTQQEKHRGKCYDKHAVEFMQFEVNRLMQMCCCISCNVMRMICS